MTDPKTGTFPRPAADNLPYPPIASTDLGADAEAAIQSAQTFTPSNEDTDAQRVQANPDAKSSRWHTPLLLIVAAIVGAVFLLAIR
jgi:hypothetical protein